HPKISFVTSNSSTRYSTGMVDKIDMSLDEIIKREGITVGKRGRRGGGAFRGKVTPIGAPGSSKNKPPVKKIGAVGKHLKSTGSDKATNFVPSNLVCLRDSGIRESNVLILVLQFDFFT